MPHLKTSGLNGGIAFTAALFLLVVLIPQAGVAQGKRLPAEEFRLAAESRVSWHDPDLAPDATSETWVKAKILGFNDFHGHLNGASISGRPVGGAAVLSAYLQSESKQVEGRAIIVHAGDMVGASPPVSALMHDEPSIQVLNLMANEHCSAKNLYAKRCNVVGTVGNHEFDEGTQELMRLLYGGRYQDTDFLGSDWAGANVPYVSANVVIEETGKTILPPYVIKEIDGIPIAFIGAVLKNTPQVVTPSGIAGLRFLDEATAINSYIPELKAQNVHAIVVTIHQGTWQTNFGPAVRVGDGGLQGQIIDIVMALDEEVDVVVSGHAHGYNNVLVPTESGKQILLTQAFSYGTAYSDIDIVLDPVSGEIVEKSAAIMTTWADQGPGLSPDPEIAALVEQANIAVQPMVDRVIGVAAEDIRKDSNLAGESTLGDLIADSHVHAMDIDFAFTGSGAGGMRADIEAGEIRWGELFTIKPFGNTLVAMSLTGEQIYRLLNQQWVGRSRGYFLQISGLRYSWDAKRPEDDRIVEILDAAGEPLDRLASYRVGIASFHASGGDGFTVFEEGTDQVVGPLVLDALIDYIRSLAQPISVQLDGRIKRLN